MHNQETLKEVLLIYMEYLNPKCDCGKDECDCQ